ncbi:hypothetical protein [Terricaulis silvestris]|uniref:Uncharacterized protein n=1 Tax=Terricaulis silvestris TaxID=2686094 RepID=A0A6I6MKF2_9CAUL|nr:hypothetical protein [Terricaulis silvestris]QGZ95720.1 hypothetical protein DSM104635_02571 [Terricaulis silvestris]
MLDDRPILKDRLMAFGTFSGIAVAAVAGFEMVIGGGMDFLMPGQEIRAVAPSSYVRVVDTPWADQTRLVPLSSNEYMFAGEAPVAEERLAGARDDADAPRGSYPEVSEDDLYADIDALYQRQGADALAVEDIDANSGADEEEPYVLYVDEKKAEGAATGVGESASPW